MHVLSTFYLVKCFTRFTTVSEVGDLSITLHAPSKSCSLARWSSTIWSVARNWTVALGVAMCSEHTTIVGTYRDLWGRTSARGACPGYTRSPVALTFKTLFYISQSYSTAVLAFPSSTGLRLFYIHQSYSTAVLAFPSSTGLRGPCLP